MRLSTAIVPLLLGAAAIAGPALADSVAVGSSGGQTVVTHNGKPCQVTTTQDGNSNSTTITAGNGLSGTTTVSPGNNGASVSVGSSSDGSGCVINKGDGR